MNQVGKSQQILLTKGQREVFNNSQSLKKIQEKPQGLKCNIELIFKNIRPQKIEHKTKEKKLKNPKFSIRRRTGRKKILLQPIPFESTCDFSWWETSEENEVGEGSHIQGE